MRICRICKTKLTRQNAYRQQNNSRRLRHICKECRKKQIMASERERKVKKPTYRVKAINRANPIEFSTYQAKHQFVTLRRLQSIGVRPKVGHSSRVGQRVEHIEEERNEDDGEVRRYYQETLCSECGSIIRYDDRGFKVCISCGLLAELFTLDNELGPDLSARDLRADEYYSHARRD